MKNKRRDFLKMTGLTGISLAGGVLNGFAASPEKQSKSTTSMNQFTSASESENASANDEDLSLIGLYGPWASGLTEKAPLTHSFRNKKFTNAAKWQKEARKRFTERLAVPDIGGMPKVTVHKTYVYDGLHIEEITWQLPYGRPTQAILLKPADAKGPLPGILAFHDHGGNKYLGTKKIARTSDDIPEYLKYHYDHYYEGKAWANEVAKRGYVVLVSDAFTFGSRRVLLQDVPQRQRRELNDNDPENPENISKYNDWASSHEAIMAKSLFSAGTTWPGVFFAEDKKALDILCAREDVDANRVGCCGLSGGGLRTVVMAGMDPRIKCAVPVGFMTTWKDFILYKSFTHTWMAYVPLSPNEMDFPEILGLRVPLASLVLNNSEDQLFTLSEMKRADDILKEVYTKAGAADRYKCSFHPGLHKFDAKMQAEAFDWFDKWLKS